MANASVILVSYKNTEDTINCIDSVNNFSGTPFNLVVVVNDNNLDSLNLISAFVCALNKKFLKNYRIVISQNYGFGSGCNLGASISIESWKQPEYLWFLNNDCVIRQDCLKNLIAHSCSLSTPSIVGSYIFTPKGDLQCAGGGRINWFLGVQKQVKSGSLDYITGASLLIPANSFFRLSGFNPNYFLYWEETDLCRRAKSLGIEMAVAKDSIVVHKIGGSTGYKSDLVEYYSCRNALFFFKAFGPSTFFPFVFIANLMIKIFNRIRRRQFKQIAVVLRAYRSFLANDVKDFKNGKKLNVKFYDY